MAARRVRLPSADDLFRSTADRDAGGSRDDEKTGRRQSRVRAVPEPPEGQEPDGADQADQADEPASRRRSSGRVRHDEKMTVYITSDELLELEHARLSLRRDHGVAIDRGRLVREAVAIVLADLEASGGSSALVQRLVGG